MTEDMLLFALFGLIILSALLLPMLGENVRNRVAGASAVAITGIALSIGVLALIHPPAALFAGGLDRIGAIFFMTNAIVGCASALLSPGYLRGHTSSLLPEGARWYWLGFYLFWGSLLAIPATTNLGSGWLLIEASTGTSAFLVAYSGGRRSLEAGWKYLILTTMGLTVAFAGIVVLEAGEGAHLTGIAALEWPVLHALVHQIPPATLYLADILVFAGFATKAGLAPVHHWLPDAHSEAPAPVSAMLSASLLPSVILILWRLQGVLGNPVGSINTSLFTIFGLFSIAVAVPFLWTALPVKRLLAYSTLEHVGVLAVGIGFATPLALAGVILHFTGHALAKSLGFYSSMPAMAAQKDGDHKPLSGLARQNSPAAAGLSVSLLALGGAPPSPLFLSELLIMAGGIAAHQIWATILFAVLLAMGFLGLMRQAIEVSLGRTRHGSPHAQGGPIGWLLPATFSGLLLAVSAIAVWAYPMGRFLAHLGWMA